MNVSLFDKQGNQTIPEQQVDALTIEASLPELRALAKFFAECAKEVEEKVFHGPDDEDLLLEGDIPDYQMSVAEIFVS